jgi:hypothetical protein
MTKKIKFVVYLLAILGLLTEVLALFSSNLIEGLKIVPVFRNYFSCLRLSCFKFNIFEYQNFDNGISLNYINTTFYLLLLIGAILFSISKEKESRLLNFVLSVVLISNIISLLWHIILPIFFVNLLINRDNWLILLILAIIKDAVYCYASFYILNILNPTRNNIDNSNTIVLPEFEEVSKLKRFGHLILDGCICFFIFSKYEDIFSSSLFKFIRSHAGESFAIYAIFIISSLIYYLFFEIIFGSTPAKFLTQTKVVDEEGKKPKFEKIIIRTLARYIPFESFSFFGTKGWHDSISKTQVYCYVRKGVKGESPS